MISTLVFVVLCCVGVVFLLFVLGALIREDRPRFLRRTADVRSSAVVVKLPPDPIFMAKAIRPVEVPEDAPFAIVSNGQGSAAEFYSTRQANRERAHGEWALFVNPERPRLKKAR